MNAHSVPLHPKRPCLVTQAARTSGHCLCSFSPNEAVSFVATPQMSGRLLDPGLQAVRQQNRRCFHGTDVRSFIRELVTSRALLLSAVSGLPAWMWPG